MAIFSEPQYKGQHFWNFQWYTVKKSCTLYTDDDASLEVKLKAGDMIEYKGCRLLDAEWWHYGHTSCLIGGRMIRFFEFNGCPIWTSDRWICNHLEPN